MAYVSIPFSPPSKRNKLYHLRDDSPATFLKQPGTITYLSKRSGISIPILDNLDGYSFERPVEGQDESMASYSTRVSSEGATLQVRGPLEKIMSHNEEQIKLLNDRINQLQDTVKSREDDLDRMQLRFDGRDTLGLKEAALLKKRTRQQFLFGAVNTLITLAEYVLANEKPQKKPKSVPKAQQSKKGNPADDYESARRVIREAQTITLEDLTNIAKVTGTKIDDQHLRLLHKALPEWHDERNKVAHDDPSVFAAVLEVEMEGLPHLGLVWEPLFSLLYGQTIRESAAKEIKIDFR